VIYLAAFGPILCSYASPLYMAILAALAGSFIMAPSIIRESAQRCVSWPAPGRAVVQASGSAYPRGLL